MKITTRKKNIWDRFDEVFVVSCVEYKSRIDYLKQELNRIGIRRFHILYDFKSPLKEILQRHITTSKFLSNQGPFSCLLGHYRAMKTAYGLGANTCLIVEDDAAFLKDLSIVEEEVETLPQDFDIAQFSHVKPMPMSDSEYVASLNPIEGNVHWKRFSRLRDNGCYALSRRAMSRLINLIENSFRGASELVANDRLVDRIEDLNKYAVFPNMAVQNLFPVRNSSDHTYWDRLIYLDGIRLEDYNLSLQGGRVVIFTNVFRYGSDVAFEKAVRMLELTDADTLVFMNKAVPLAHIRDLSILGNAKIVSLHRIHYLSNGSIEWFGEKEMLERVSRGELHSPILLHLDNEGNIFDTNNKPICKIPFGEGYPEGKYPTTGYLAVKFAQEYIKGPVVLVNFYGNDDNSTGKYFMHAWDFEDAYIKKLPNRMFMEQESYKQNSGTTNGYRLGKPNIFYSNTQRKNGVDW